jgi:putative membrane protein
MAMLTEQEQEKVSAAIHEVESRTDAELVTVLASQADAYVYIPTLWAAALALVSPWALGFTPLWLEVGDLLIIQLIVFVVLAFALRFPPIMFRLVPKSVRHWRASNLARREFLEQNLHHTKGDTGLLIFVSAAEHYVEILADRGISEQVPDEQWQRIVAAFVEHVKAGRTLEGFVECIEACGELLATHIPATAEKNELPNHLIIL